MLAPHAALRELVVAYGSPEPEQLEPSAVRCDAPATASKDRRYWAWADLMRRAFKIDVLACPRCGGRMQLIATIEDPSVHPEDSRAPRIAHRGPKAAPAARPRRRLAAVRGRRHELHVRAPRSRAARRPPLYVPGRHPTDPVAHDFSLEDSVN